MPRDFRWYLRRVIAMSPSEVALRISDTVSEKFWRYRYFNRDTAPTPQYLKSSRPAFVFTLPDGVIEQVGAEARAAIIESANELLAGRWPIFGTMRDDVGPKVNWHLDAKNSEQVSCSEYSFELNLDGPFDIKFVWELSRHHHSTLCAMAYWLTGEDRYAEFAADQITSWCEANPFLHGAHWMSGIETGVRLISFVWVRRLLGGWPEIAARFDDCEFVGRRLYEMQWLLSRRFSYGSSANNHLMLEAAGLFVSACAFPWFFESRNWQKNSASVLERELPKQTFDSGLNRELASDYQGFVLEAVLAAALEGDMADAALSDNFWAIIRRMFEVVGALSDCRGHPPRQGDGDDAHGLLLDAPEYDRWIDIQSTGLVLNGAAAWWPEVQKSTARTTVHSALIRHFGRDFDLGMQRPRMVVVEDAGLAILRAGANENEIYCAFDAGPLGYLSIAAHGHADALSIELRVGGQPVLVDPGTYNYHSGSQWRDYFRSTLAHNTLEVAGENQSVSGGAFLWTDKAAARILEYDLSDTDGECLRVTGEHDGYRRRPMMARHCRSLSLDPDARVLTVHDFIQSEFSNECRLMFHLHPNIQCQLSYSSANLVWNTTDGKKRAVMRLSEAFSWSVVSGESASLGWYSPSYDKLISTNSLVGKLKVGMEAKFSTEFELLAD